MKKFWLLAFCIVVGSLSGARLVLANPEGGAHSKLSVSDLIDTDSTFDVTYVHLDLTVRPDTEYVSGSAELKAIATGLRNDNIIQLSLRAQLSVDSITSFGEAIAFSRTGDKLFVTLLTHYPNGAVFDIVIHYHGYSTIPDRRGFIHTWQDWQPTGIPISWSASEPYGAKVWWPCKDNPADKIDSADLSFTCVKPYSIASNGTLVSVIEHDSSRTFNWRERYPIDHYLIAFLCSKFDTVSHVHQLPDGQNVQITSYVFPGSLDTIRAQLQTIDTILDVYSEWFGSYPFAKEKYGLAQWHGGGMENQTLSFCNDANLGILAHETAHQWFGDDVTCKTWNDCWLNEGFASYMTDLYLRHQLGDSTLQKTAKDREEYVTSEPGGSVHTPDSLLQDNALDGRLVYSKGAAVLHMLRFVLGSDTAFYRAIREYAMGPLKYGVASTEDFRRSVEQSSGKDLKWFFDEWVYGNGYPKYSVDWNIQDAMHPSVTIDQQGSVASSPLFIMPIELKFEGVDYDTTVLVYNDLAPQTWQFNFDHPVSKLTFDPHNWILDGQTTPRVLGVRLKSEHNTSVSIHQHGNDVTANYDLSKAEHAVLHFYDVLGRELTTIDEGHQSEGPHTATITLALTPGVYFCRLDLSGESSTVRFVFR